MPVVFHFYLVSFTLYFILCLQVGWKISETLNIAYVDNKVCLPLLHLGKAIIQDRSLMTGKVWREVGLAGTSFGMFQLLLHIWQTWRGAAQWTGDCGVCPVSLENHELKVSISIFAIPNFFFLCMFSPPLKILWESPTSVFVYASSGVSRALAWSWLITAMRDSQVQNQFDCFISASRKKILTKIKSQVVWVQPCLLSYQVSIVHLVGQKTQLDHRLWRAGPCN